jgi:hypothetical protein
MCGRAAAVEEEEAGSSSVDGGGGDQFERHRWWRGREWRGLREFWDEKHEVTAIYRFKNISSSS